MPNCDFYACGEDHRLILEFLIADGQCDLWELYSDPGEECQKFESLDDFSAKFGFRDWNSINTTIHLNLYPHNAGGRLSFRRIDLKSVPAPEKAFRFSAEGWGMVQLYLEPPRKGILQQSHTNHNSETRAKTWHSTIPDMGDPVEWNWSAVNSFSRRLNSFVRKSAVDKVKSQVVLPCAHSMRATGLKFWPWDRDPKDEC
jgi:hypothetical protein